MLVHMGFEDKIISTTAANDTNYHPTRHISLYIKLVDEHLKNIQSNDLKEISD